jgi:nicotinate-nucleotide adenylyltransferase
MTVPFLIRDDTSNKQTSRRVGIFPGTFDPVHQGHIAFCLEASRMCQLDEVVLLPEPVPHGKQRVTDMAHRVALLDTAIANYANIRVLTLGSEQFSVKDTLPALQRIFPNAELVMLMGSDVASTLMYRWEDVKQLLEQLALAIGVRHGDMPEGVAHIMQQLEERYNHPVRYTLIPSPHAKLASSRIRSGAVPARSDPATAAYIQRHGLYEQAP